MNSKPLTPLQKLTAEKNRIKQLTKEQEAKLSEHYNYVQSNAGSLLLSFVSSMLFSKSSSKDTDSTVETSNQDTNNEPASSLSFSDLIPMSKLLLPMVWEIAKPMLLSWGIKKVSQFTASFFTRRKV